MFNRCRRQAGFEQFDPAAIHNLVIGRCSDSHGPAQMMGDPHAHALKYLAPGSTLSAACLSQRASLTT